MRSVQYIIFLLRLDSSWDGIRLRGLVHSYQPISQKEHINPTLDLPLHLVDICPCLEGGRAGIDRPSEPNRLERKRMKLRVAPSSHGKPIAVAVGETRSSTDLMDGRVEVELSFSPSEGPIVISQSSVPTSLPPKSKSLLTQRWVFALTFH